MGHATIEWVYVGVVISILIWVGAESWNVERQIEHVPPNAETIRVIAQQWFWTFEHQDGTKEVGQLHVKQGVPYKFEIVSKDVIHDFNVPEFTILMDAVPGRVNVLWNLFDKSGEYPIQCREYCGFSHADMRAKLFVEPFSQTAEATSNATSTPAITETVNTTSTQTNVTKGTPLAILEGASIQGQPAFDPNPITVKKGDAITVTNKDTLPHTVTSGTGPTDTTSGKSFDTSIIEGGSTANIATASLNPADYPFYCSVHPYMTGKLTVQ